MGQEEIAGRRTPEYWAIRLSQIIKIVHETHGLERFPIKVAQVARDFSLQVFPNEPITLVDGAPLSNKFEGALIPSPHADGEWGIVYNKAIKSKGRQNFTLGHELGHYLMHRHLVSNPLYCAKGDMWQWNSEYGKMESEANRFASFLLMPLDDFREQTKDFERPTIEDFGRLRDRYEVSLTAAILKWLEITSKRAMIVVSIDGFIDWSRSSQPLLKSGVFFRARQEITPLPSRSLAADNSQASHPELGELLRAGVWAEHEEVHESVIFSEYHGMAISLLIYPNHGPNRWRNASSEFDDPDVFDKFQDN